MSVSPTSVCPPSLDREICCAPNTYIETQNLRLDYKSKTAFQDVSLSVGKGCITALVGPSGCGKTSFLTCLNRLTDLIPNATVTGVIKVDGQDILGRNVDVLQLRRRVGMIFQKPNPFPLSIWRNMELPLREHGVNDKAQLKSEIEAALKSVGLWDEVKDRLNGPALALSGGQQQRLCIARALTLTPDVLLMDEPCSALDPLSSGIVEDLIISLRNRYTVIIVTHNLAQARRIADSVAIFWVQDGSGRLIESGPTKQIFETPTDPLTASYISGSRG
ncbi:MAG: phosphate ABC transporter ATP-binding protein [Planctomycetota bacterium]